MKLQALKQYLMHRPLIASLHITSKCNLRCVHCPDSVTEESTEYIEPSTSQWLTIMEDLKERGIIGLIIWGGEPMMLPRIEEIMDYANKNFITSFHTNGMTDFSHIKANTIFVSLDGMKETNDKIRGKGTFDKIIENINKYPDKSKIIIAYTITSMNDGDVHMAIPFVKKLGVSIGFQSYYTEDPDDPLSLSEKNKERIYHSIAYMTCCISPSYPIVNSHKNLQSMIEGGHKCHRWAFTSYDSTGLEHPRKCLPLVDCDKCGLMCFNEINLALSLKWGAIQSVKRVLL